MADTPLAAAKSHLWERLPSYAMLMIAIGGSIMGLMFAWWNIGRDVDDVHEWQADHMAYHAERSTTLDTQLAAVNSRLAGIDDNRRRIDELTFRLGAAEENGRRTGESIQDLQSTVNDQAADIRVMREILERLDQRAEGTGARLARNGSAGPPR